MTAPTPPLRQTTLPRIRYMRHRHAALRCVLAAHGRARGVWTTQAASSSAASADLELLRLTPDGASSRTAATLGALGVHPRDAALFRRTSFCSQPATLDWRGAEQGLFLCLEPFKAILRSSEALVFDAQRSVVASVVTYVQASVVRTPHAFTLSVLDSLLSASATHFRGRLARLCAAVDAALADISSSLARKPASEGGSEVFSRLVPLTRALAALASDVCEVEAALESLLCDAGALCALAGTTQPAAACQQVVSAALRSVRAVSGELRELRQHIGATREVWELQLDGTRNRLHRVALHASLAALSLSLAALPAALLGMNLILPAGLETHPSAFAMVSAGALGSAAAAFAGGAAWARAAGPASRAAALEGAHAARAMSNVLGGLDAIEEALLQSSASSGGDEGVTRERLLAALQVARPGRFSGNSAADEAEMELLFRVFDADRDGKLTHSEWLAGDAK